MAAPSQALTTHKLGSYSTCPYRAPVGQFSPGFLRRTGPAAEIRGLLLGASPGLMRKLCDLCLASTGTRSSRGRSQPFGGAPTTSIRSSCSMDAGSRGAKECAICRHSPREVRVVDLSYWFGSATLKFRQVLGHLSLHLICFWHE
jgi:hypothetical protein